MRGLVVVTMFVGCGRIAFDEAFVPPFGEAVPLEEINSTAIDNDPSLTGDLLEIYFASNRSGSNELWTSTRATPTSPWSPPTLATGLNSPMSEAAPKVSRDGLTIFFFSARTPTESVWMSTRATRTTPWSTPVEVPELTGALSTSADASLTHVVTHAALDTSSALFTSTRTSPGAIWQPPQAALELHADGELMPFLMDNALVVYFAASEPGHTLSFRDLYRAERSTPTSPFGTAQILAEVSSDISDTDPWVSEDERVIVFARGTEQGGNDLYEARR